MRLIVCTPPPGIAKVITVYPARPSASVIAWRNDPGPLSAVVVTAIEVLSSKIVSRAVN